jgi:hypothetical protein
MANINPKMVKWEDSPTGAIDQKMVKWDGDEPKTSMLQNIKGGAGDLLAGAVRGAGSIGATILSPYDMAMDAIKGKGAVSRNDTRRQDMTGALQNMGADPESLLFQGGKLTSEIAGTAGAGGLLAKGLTALGGAVPALAPYVPKVATALETGGFRTIPPSFVGPAPAATLGTKAADMALRTGAGAAVGGTAAGLVDPDQAGTGLLIGGALPGAVKVAGTVGAGVRDLTGALTKKVIGATTGVGSEAVNTAYKAGVAGDRAFLDNMRGNVNMTDVLDEAKAAVGRMRVARGNEYRQGMAGVSADKTVLDMTPIRDAVNNIASMGSYKGQAISKNASATVKEIADQVDDWVKLNPADYHTPEGLDALKKAIGDIRDATQFGTPGRKAADGVYHAVKAQIEKQAPTYAKTMKGYSEATELISEIERSLVGGNKTSADTAMRKLQSLMRNNVNTNYGNRLDLARELEQQGGASLLPSIAGQAMTSATPRGLQGLAATGTGVYGLTNPLALAALPFQSTRLMGEAFYGMGRVGAKAGNAANGLLSNPALSSGQGGLLSPSTLLPLMATVPAVSMSR